MENLLPNESLISQSDGNIVNLTTHRIMYEDKNGWGHTYHQSIMLEHVSSCEFLNYHNVILLILTAISLIASVFSIFSNLGRTEIAGLFIMTLVFYILWNRSKHGLIVIGSASTKMKINVSGMNQSAALTFINKIETAINNRSLLLSNK